MNKIVRRAAVSLVATSALMLAGSGAALAHDHAAFKECLKANFAAAGSEGAVAGSIQHCIASHASSS